ncbi:MAG: ABC transporter ATP-binding protein [Thermoplasmata archaeon]
MELRNISKVFVKVTTRYKTRIKAVDDISLEIMEGKNIGIIGESGSGKTTLGKIMVKLLEPDKGEIYYKNKEITYVKRNKIMDFKKEVQMIFQDPYSSLDPRMKIGDQIRDFIKLGGNEPSDKLILKYLSMVNLSEDILNKRPIEISGGQRQRVAIAKVLTLNPRLIVADEPVSALDASIRSQVITTLQNLASKSNITFVYITHDISTLPFVVELINVMYRGKIVETGTINEIIKDSYHPYTRALLEAVPDINNPNKNLNITIRGIEDENITREGGCVFYDRCPYAKPICEKEVPLLKEIKNGHKVACHLYG